MLIIRGPIKPYKPDKTIFSALTNLTIDFDFK